MKLSPRAVNRCDVLTACFRDIQSQRSIRMEFNYYDFIRREGLSLPIWQLFTYKHDGLDVPYKHDGLDRKYKRVDRFFAYVHQLMFAVIKLAWIHIE